MSQLEAISEVEDFNLAEQIAADHFGIVLEAASTIRSARLGRESGAGYLCSHRPAEIPDVSGSPRHWQSCFLEPTGWWSRTNQRNHLRSCRLSG
jgi:hypothetical protein